MNKAHTSPLTNRNGEAGTSLNAEGKALLVGAFNDFMDKDTIRYRGRNLVRSHCIQLDAHQFANALIKEDGAGPADSTA
ncbi:hypothetical protein [Arsenicibacter rosenii]|uniref:hypothetical protein n=1 Tax=Arsenicibacter rosenii TaxID=1750698 RepID=UPI000AD4AD45|nr:hypothetical protein [Arsenicibacter rosenii]